MAIVEMSKITLLGLNKDKQKILDSLFSSKLVELNENVKPLPKTSTLFDQNKFESLDLYCSKLERAISLIEENLPLETKLENVFDVTMEDFKNIDERKPKVETVLHELDLLSLEKNENKKERANIENKLNQLMPFCDVKENFDSFKNTKNVTILLGIIPSASLKEFDLFLKDCPLSTYEICGQDNNILKLFSHKSESERVVKKLMELGFSKCNITLDTNAKTAIKDLQKQLEKTTKIDEKINAKYKEFVSDLKDIKILRDYVKFCIEKEEAENKFSSTSQSFVLEGFLARENEQKLSNFLDKLNLDIEYEFSKPKKNEIPPTITKNSEVVSQFEFVTNMYSAPRYGEIDPNFFVTFFFSLFFGFIMADVGYGVCLILFGYVLAKKQPRQTGFKKLMNVLCIGGITSVLFGVLFGSFFGVVLPCFNVSKLAGEIIEKIVIALLLIGLVQLAFSLVAKIINKGDKNKTELGVKVLGGLSGTFAKIGVVFVLVGTIIGAFFGKVIPVCVLPNPVSNVIVMLVACLVAGVVQIMVSFMLKGLLLIKRGRVFEAIFSSFTWDFFFVGLMFFALDFAGIYSGLKTVGIVLAIASVGLTVVGLAIINKGFERFSKGFGAVYGIINLFSDILSYARLFGLMLSGAIIATIVNQLAADFLLGPVTFVVGVIILFIGHAFNLAMGALGAYIHVARLQYIEFFSRFYEGEGELFVPFGQTNFQYVNLIK